MPKPSNFSSVSYWEKRYADKHTHWHIDKVHPVLDKNIALLTGDKVVKVFVPLCGKTVDIPFLLSLGHEVFAVEGVQKPILELAEENSIHLNFDPNESLYYTHDKRLKIYFGDIFTCPLQKYGPFHCVWDRGSFTSVEYPSRQDYVRVLKESLFQNEKGVAPFKYLLQTYSYDKSKFDGPPTAVDSNDLTEYFSSWAQVTKIEQLPLPAKKPFPKNAEEIFYLLEPRAK